MIVFPDMQDMRKYLFARPSVRRVVVSHSFFVSDFIP